MILKNSTNTIAPSSRPYQSQAISELTLFVKEFLREISQENRGYFSSASLLEMATGSGKTFTVGKYVEKLLKIRDKSAILRKMFSNLKVVLISNRIDGVTQFRDDLMYGRSGVDGKLPILSEKVRKNIKISTYHSRADGEDLNDRNEEVEIENMEGGNEFIFSTWQTANEKDLASKIPYADIVIIDEAHNVRPNSDFFHVINTLSKKGRNGKVPLILPITATPTNVTKELFGEPVFTFGIGEYLASGYAPNVEYHVITGIQGTAEEVKELVSMIRRAKEEQDFETKETLVKEARSLFDALMAKDIGIDSFAEDILDRLKEKSSNPENQEKEIQETIIFARSIHDADMIAREMIVKSGIVGFALSYHSQNDDNEALKRLTDPHDPCRIVIAVDKLNESIDIPVVRNIVFYRYTQDPKIYLQQFGRGLRGIGVVRYYDYIGGMENFSWIGQIQEKYSASVKMQGNNLGDQNTSFIIHAQTPGIGVASDVSQNNSSSSIPPWELNAKNTDADSTNSATSLPGQKFFADHIIMMDTGAQVTSLHQGQIVQRDEEKGNEPKGIESIESAQDVPEAKVQPSEMVSIERNIQPTPTFYDTELDVLGGGECIKGGVNTKGSTDMYSPYFSGTSHFVNLADLGLFIEQTSQELEKLRNISMAEIANFIKTYSHPNFIKSFHRNNLDILHAFEQNISMRVVRGLRINGIPFTRIPILNSVINGNKAKWISFLRTNIFAKELHDKKTEEAKGIMEAGDKLRNTIIHNPRIAETFRKYSFRPGIYRCSLEGLEHNIDVYMCMLEYPKMNDSMFDISIEELGLFLDWVKNRGYIKLENTSFISRE